MDYGRGEEGGAARVCLRCGKIAASSDVFCTSCGADLRSAPSPGLAGSADVEAFRAARGEGGQAGRGVPPVSRSRQAEIMPGAAPVLPPYAAAGSHGTQGVAVAGGTVAHGPYPAPPAMAWISQVPKTDELAVASFVCAAASFVIPFLPAVAAVILGVMARKRIASSGGRLEGEGLVLAGIILGSLNLAFCLLLLLLVVASLLA